MANSYIDYRGKSARINDQLLTILALIAADMVDQTTDSDTARNLVRQWPSASLNAGPGLIEFDLTGFWETEEGVAAMRLLLRRVEERVRSFGDKVPGTLLQDLAPPTKVRFVDTDVQLITSELDKWKAMLPEE